MTLQEVSLEGQVWGTAQVSGRPLRRQWSDTAGEGQERTASRDPGGGIPVVGQEEDRRLLLPGAVVQSHIDRPKET